MKKGKIVSMVLLIQLLTPFFSILEIEVIPSTAKQQGVTLYGITRHDGTIYTKFTNAFKAKFPEVDNIWWLERTEVSAWKSAIESGSNPVSILWGGGPNTFDTLAEEGLLSSFNDTELIDYIETNISENIAGSDMIRYDNSDDILWVASSLTSYGFTVNHDNLALYNLSIPETWEDLASPEYFLGTTQHAIGMGDAPASSSNTDIYQIILQKYGWEKGWEILTRMAGNAKIFEGGSGSVRDSVMTGNQAIALTMDLFGYQAQVYNPSCEYIIPKNCSNILAGPIAIAKTALNITIAQEFVKFVLSAEGQSIWLDLDISRLPILYDAFDHARDFNGNDREDLRQVFFKTINATGILFNESLALSIYDIVIFYFYSAITSPSAQLYSAWKNLITAYRDDGVFSKEEFRSLSRKMSKPNISLQDAILLQNQYLLNPNMSAALVLEFSTYAKSNYYNILSLTTLSISSPVNGSTVYDNVTIKASVHPNNSYNISYVIFSLFNNSITLPTLANISTNFGNIQFIWDTTEVDDGIYSLNITVIDEEGIMYSQIISIVVNNHPEITTTSFLTSETNPFPSNEITTIFAVLFFLLTISAILVINRKK